MNVRTGKRRTQHIAALIYTHPHIGVMNEVTKVNNNIHFVCRPVFSWSLNQAKVPTMADAYASKTINSTIA